MTDNIKVIVRCRPFNQRETREKAQCAVEIDSEARQITCRNPEAREDTQGNAHHAVKSFTFDAVYGMEARNVEIFDRSFMPMIRNILEGYNATIFAYGQTGSGKTWTMTGNKDEPGATPNSFCYLFDQISKAGENEEYLVLASYIELYNEEIRDLLSGQERLQIKEDPDKGVYIKDLHQQRVKSDAELLKLMDKGFSNRSVAATLMNATSSRSHSIFMVRIEHAEMVNGRESIRVGKLNMVDLAGSERQKKTGAEGERLVEAAKINQSLSCLGNVISKLVARAPFIPYRDSKLTRLLQDSLGGNSRTLMCANISPASTNYEETLSTLLYANRAKQIKNKPKVNEDPKDAQIREMRDYIKELEERVRRAQEGGLTAKDMAELGAAFLKANAMVSGDALAGAGPGAGGGAAEGAGAPGPSGATGAPDAENGGGDEEEEIIYAEGDEERIREYEQKKAEALQRLQQQEESAQAAKVTIQDLKKQLLEMKGELVHGHQQRDAVRQKEMAIREARLKMQERREKEEIMRRALEERARQQAEADSSAMSVQEQIEAATRQLEELRQKVESARQQLADNRELATREYDDAMAEMMEMGRKCGKLQLLVEVHIPPHKIDEYLRRYEYDSEQEEWVLKQAYSHASMITAARRLQVIFGSSGGAGARTARAAQAARDPRSSGASASSSAVPYRSIVRLAPDTDGMSGPEISEQAGFSGGPPAGARAGGASSLAPLPGLAPKRRGA